MNRGEFRTPHQGRLCGLAISCPCPVPCQERSGGGAYGRADERGPRLLGGQHGTVAAAGRSTVTLTGSNRGVQSSRRIRGRGAELGGQASGFLDAQPRAPQRLHPAADKPIPGHGARYQSPAEPGREGFGSWKIRLWVCNEASFQGARLSERPSGPGPALACL